MFYCYKCGAQLDDGDLFCGECGASVGGKNVRGATDAKPATAQDEELDDDATEVEEAKNENLETEENDAESAELDASRQAWLAL